MTGDLATARTPAELARRCLERPLVFDDVRPELCPPLAAIVLDRMRSDGGRRVGSLNVGGWKSAEDFFAWPDAPIQELRSTIGAAVGTSALVGWAMVNRAGSRHPRHQHRVAIVTGVYYVAAGSEDAVTPTVFECPCDAQPTARRQRYEFAVDPYPGRLAIFRGEMWHHVPPYPGQLPRITIAFDVRR